MSRLFVGETCEAHYLGDKKRVVFTYDGPVKMNEHKDMYRQVMSFLETHPIENFIMDFRKIDGTFGMLSDWVIDTMRPAVERGLSKCAMVLNQDIFTSYSAYEASQKVTRISLKVFDSMEKAEHWVEKK